LAPIQFSQELQYSVDTAFLDDPVTAVQSMAAPPERA